MLSAIRSAISGFQCWNCGWHNGYSEDERCVKCKAKQ